MRQGTRQLVTRLGAIRFPAYFPVTTFGEKYPLDRLIQPYLSRLAPGVLVSAHYARQMTQPLRVPMLVDSGGFASLREGSRILGEGKLGVLEVTRDDCTGCTHPRDLLELQEQVADVAFTLDFPIPPGMAAAEAKQRQKWTIENALWALANRRRRDLPLFACVQAWDAASAAKCARVYARAGFDGVALGGLVPRARDTELVCAMVRTVREQVGDLPLHVFGLGKPSLVNRVTEAGADSVDSSTYVKLAAEGKLWGNPDVELKDASPLERLHLAILNLALFSRKPLPLSALTTAGVGVIAGNP
jgi:helicase